MMTLCRLAHVSGARRAGASSRRSRHRERAGHTSRHGDVPSRVFEEDATMRYRLSKHAADQRQDRHIGTAEIDSVVQSPEQILPGQRGTKIHQGRIRGGTMLLRLVIDDRTDPATIVTIYPTSQINRYWRKEP
jgi:hypothetical protein